MFVKFHTSVEKQLDFKIKSLQSDNGGEFKAFSSYLVAHGIKHGFSCPYTPEQNGRVERKLRHLTKTGLAFLAKASLPLSFWLHVFHTTIFRINRLPTKVLKYQSPFQTLFGKTPDYHFLKIFGCLCYPYIRPYNKHKLQYRSTQCIFLSCSNTHKGYLCFDPKTTRLYLTRHVVFHESVFPTLSPSTSSNPSFSVSTPTFLPLHMSSSLALHSIDAQQHNPTPLSSPLHLSSNHILPTIHNNVPQHPPIINSHPMVTHAKDGIVKKKAFLSHMPTELATFSQASKSIYWTKAMQQEYDALLKNETWNLVPTPPNANIIDCKWVYKLKHNPDGTIARYKAHLVAKGFTQTHGLNYFEPFSPVVKASTIRIVLAPAISYN